MAPRTSGFASCEVGQQSLYQGPVSTTSRLPSASSITSVGWKSRLLETRKSDSRLAEGGAARRQHVAGDLLQVEHRGEKVVAVVVAERGRTRSCVRPAGAAAPSCDSTGIRSPVRGVAVDHRVRLAVDAAIDRVHASRRGARAAGARGKWRSGSARPVA